jgi:NACHT domain
MATVAQWVGQVDDLGEGDRIGLATAEPQGPVKALGAALDRRRRLVPGAMLPAESKALDAVDRALPPGTPAEKAGRVLDAAVVLAVAASTARDEGFRSVANLLDGTVVPSGSGSAAIDALQQAFRVQAAAGTGSCIDDWLEILAAAGLEVFADAAGRAGPRRRAELDAMTAHCSRLACRDGVLGLALVDDLPEIHYPPLADSLRIASEQGGDSLLATARRWRRMMLTGLPGMGKSTALQQLAARWAADDRAPTPILVALRDVALRNPRSAADITPAVLVEVATATVPEEERLPLRRALLRELATGRAALLLDGLDECGPGPARAVVADGLAAVAKDIHPDAGFILATRDSGIAAAARLELPEARLVEPNWLTSMLMQLLGHAARHRVAEADRKEWLDARLRQLDELLATHHQLCSVPLFALLLTLLISRRDPSGVRVGRAQLLSQAVWDAVDRWELNRLSENDSRRDLRREQLIDGYSEVAHALVNEPAGRSKAMVSRRLEAMLSSEWGLSPGEARARAGDIVWFWDERMGIFVAPSSGGGLIEARSRVFAEIGDAMWASRCRDDDVRRAWVRGAVRDDDRREQAILAASLSSDVAEEIIEEAACLADATSRPRALLLAVDAVVDGATPGDEALQILITALGRDAATSLASPAESPERHGMSVTRPSRPGWRLVVGIAMLLLPKTLRAQRNQVLAGCALDAEERVLVKALVALADAGADASDWLGPEQEEAVQELLAMELPDSSGPRFKPSTRPGFVVANREGKPFHGHYEAVNQSAKYVSQLGRKAADSMYRVARQGTTGNYGRLQSRLTRAGYSDPEPLLLTSGLPTATERWDTWGEWEAYLAAAAQLGQPRPLSPAEQWSYPNLAVLDDILDSGEATLDGIALAFRAERALLADCIKAVAHSAGLDLPAIAAEAVIALEHWQDGDRGVIDVMFAPPQGTPPSRDAGRLDANDVPAMLAAIGAASEWISDIACELLTLEPDPSVGQWAERLIGQIPANRRVNIAIVAIMNDPNPVDKAVEMLNGDDKIIRIGVGIAAYEFAENRGIAAWKPVLELAMSDDDLAVRVAAGAAPGDNGTAVCWTCSECVWTNKISSKSCESCGCTMSFNTPRKAA